MEKLTRLLSESQFTRFVFGNDATSDFILVDSLPIAKEAQHEFADRGLTFAGLLGVIQGEPMSVLTVPMDAATINAITQAFVSSAMSDTAVAEQFTAFLATRLSSGGSAN